MGTVPIFAAKYARIGLSPVCTGFKGTGTLFASKRAAK